MKASMAQARATKSVQGVLAGSPASDQGVEPARLAST